MDPNKYQRTPEHPVHQSYAGSDDAPFPPPNFPGATPIMQPRGGMQPHGGTPLSALSVDWNSVAVASHPIPGVVSLSVFSPQLQRAMQAELEKQATASASATASTTELAATSTFTRPNPSAALMQSSPSTYLAQPSPAPLLGVEYAATNIATSALKRPADSIAAVAAAAAATHKRPAQHQCLGPPSKKTRYSQQIDDKNQRNNENERCGIHADLPRKLPASTSFRNRHLGPAGTAFLPNNDDHDHDDHDHDPMASARGGDTLEALGSKPASNQKINWYCDGDDDDGRNNNDDKGGLGGNDDDVDKNNEKEADTIDDNDYELSSIKDLNGEDSLQSFLNQFPPVPRNKPNGIRPKLNTQLAPAFVFSEAFNDGKAVKRFHTEAEYNMRIRECETHGRRLIGSWCGVSGSDDVKWINHPVQAFNMWLRVDEKKNKTLWTCDHRTGIWKRNVYGKMYVEQLFNLYHRLWHDDKFLKDQKKILQDETKDDGDPRFNMESFRSVAFSMLSPGTGQQITPIFYNFWDSKSRKALQQKYENARPVTDNDELRQSVRQFTNEELKQLERNRAAIAAVQQRLDELTAAQKHIQEQQQQQQPAVQMASGAMSGGAIYSAKANSFTINHYHQNTPESARAPAPSSNDHNIHSV